MHAPLPPLVPTVLRADPYGWPPLFCEWRQYRSDNVNKSDALVLANFLALKVQDFNANPALLSPAGYARFFDAASDEVVWPSSGKYPYDVRHTILECLGLLAERGGTEPSGYGNMGRSLKEQWTDQATKTFSTMTSVVPADAVRASAALRLLQGRLSTEYKRVVCSKFAPSSLLLIPEVKTLVDTILPIAEEDKLPLLAWNFYDAQLNKELVAAYLPIAYPLLDLSLNDEQWLLRGAVINTMDRIAASQNAPPPSEMALPSDFVSAP